MTSNSDPSPSPSDGFQDEAERLQQQFLQQMREASTLLSQGQAKEAISLLEHCLALYPEDLNALLNLGGAYILAGQHRRAVPVLEKATALAPDNPSLWSNLAAAYLGKLISSNRTGQDKALDAYRRVVELDEAYPSVHYNIGLIYVDRRDWEAAFVAFTRAIETNPYDQDAWNMRKRVDAIRQQPPGPHVN
jgi:tetratricopeptide (TPR) repeat protein